MNLDLQKVSKNYGNKAVLREISFSVRDGEFVALLGPSGCGKTTLLNAVAGLVEIDRGSIALEGEILSRPGFTVPPEERGMGIVFQDFALWPHMTVFENVAFGLRTQRMRRSEVKERVMATLRVFHMESFASRYPGELSGGQQQRVAMARALAPRPRLVLMDEPLSSLDAQLREEMRWELIRIFGQFSITTLYVTHDRTEAMSMADTIVLLRDGQMEQVGTPQRLYEEPETAFAARFLDKANLLPGRVASLRDGWMGVDTPVGVLYAPRRDGWDIGDPVLWMCRPQRLFLAQPGVSSAPPTFSELRVRVQFRSYQGHVWRYVGVPDDGAREVSVEFPSTLPMDPGQRVTLYAETADCRALPAVGAEQLAMARIAGDF